MNLAQAAPPTLQARIQAEVGEFLAARRILEGLRARARTADDLGQVERLLVQQAQLEGELGEVLPAAQRLTRGEFDLAMAGRVTVFAARMEAHLAEVRRVRARLRGGAPEIAVSPTGVVTVIAVLIGLGLLWRAVMR